MKYALIRSFKLMKIKLVIFIGIILLSACEKLVDQNTSGAGHIPLKQTTITGGSLPNLFKDESGQIWMSYITRSDDDTKLWFTRWQESDWSNSELIAQGNNWFINWADFPSVIKVNDTFIAHWLQDNGTSAYAYGIQHAIKKSGNVWQQKGWLHADESPSEHGFVGLQPAAVGAHAIWLDGRKSLEKRTINQVPVSGMTLRYALIKEDGTITDRQEIDNLTCSCCQTATAITQNGLVVAYRDRQILSKESEIRDIHVLRQTPQGWVSAGNIPIDNWDIQACPVNGPVLTANEHNLALVWFTQAHEKSKVKLAFSSNNGQSFAPAIEIDSSENMGRVGADWLDSERLLVSWIGMIDGKGQLLYRIIHSNGDMSDTRIVAEIDKSRVSGVPQVATIDADEALFVWTQARRNPNEAPFLRTYQIQLN